ncbi:hypothetical protein C7999DRAFT_12759 [Corynascus novoguineensis]|uniref:Uncharacterized protein n=1 Tax=Corynascus novoguineensis TaxID=1126955 RepID=A0AAN7CW34_9PEZI|nr:hypothetical protein C7999DRAFT_12759 [Corynascus novoguineensis]
MFLHSGASLHGHEYSTRPSSNTQSPAHLRGPLLRSTLSPPKQRARASTEGMPAPVLRRRPASDYIPREYSHVVRFREPQDDLPPTPSTHDESISESEFSDVTLSIDGALSPPSVISRRPRRAPRKSTTYYLGYPAPRIIGKTKVVQKVFLPRLLLQLQQVSQEGRSKPVLEAFPASRIAGPVVAPRLAKKFPGIFGVKRHLGYDDIVLVRRDDGDRSSDSPESENEESLERRELLAVYCPLKHSDEAEIVLDDGSVWVAKSLPNGCFDFVHTDADGKTTTARWARRNAAAVTPTTDSSSSSTTPQARYTFSIINPLTRRHPVMATLTPSTLIVQDAYTSVSPSHALHPPVTRARRSTSPPSFTRATPYSPSKLSSSGSTSDGEGDSAVCIPSSPEPELPERTVHPVDDRTKMLISVTALWVCLRSGWSQSYDSSAASNTETATSAPSSASPTARLRGRSRRNTWTTRSSTSDTPRPLPADSSHTHGDQASREINKEGRILKRSSMPAPSSTYSSLEHSKVGNLTPQPQQQQQQQQETQAVLSTPPPTACSMVSDSAPVRSSPRRATSLGAAFMRRRFLVSSPSVSTMSRGGVFEEAVTAAAAPPPQPLPSPSPCIGQKKAEKSGADVVSQGVRKADVAATGAKRDAQPPVNVVAEGGKKSGGVRSRLVRWIHKLGSSSR